MSKSDESKQKQKEDIDSFLKINESYIEKYKKDRPDVKDALPGSLVASFKRRQSTAPGILGIVEGEEKMETVGNILNKLKNYNKENPESKIFISKDIQEVINRTIVKHQSELAESRNGKGSFLLFTGDSSLLKVDPKLLEGPKVSKKKGGSKKSKNESESEGSKKSEQSDSGFEYSDTELPKKKTDLEKLREELNKRDEEIKKALQEQQLAQGSSTASGEQLFGEYDDDNGDTISIYSDNSGSIYSVNKRTGQRKNNLEPGDFKKEGGTYNYKGQQLTNLFYTPTRVVQSLGELMEEILGPVEAGPQAVEPAQLTIAHNEALNIAEGQPEVGATTSFEDYQPELIRLYAQLGKPYGSIERNNLSKLSREQLIEEIELLQSKVTVEQLKTKAPEPITPPMLSASFPTLDISGDILEETVLLREPVEEIVVPERIIGPMQNPLLQETRALERAIINDRLDLGQAQRPAGPNDPSGNATIDGEDTNIPQDDNLKENVGIVRPFIERIHKYALKLLFESDVYPKWDPVMEKNVMSSELSEEERIKRMDIIINSYGPAISVMARVGSSVEELVELEELKACVQRNLHLGPRIYQSVSIDANQFNKIKDLAVSIDTNQQTQTAIQQESNASAIEQQLTGSGSETNLGTVQSEKEFKFNKAYDKYQEIYARGVTPAQIKKYEPTKVVITQTPITIAAQNNTTANGTPIKKIDAETISNFDTSNINYW